MYCIVSIGSGHVLCVANQIGVVAIWEMPTSVSCKFDYRILSRPRWVPDGMSTVNMDYPIAWRRLKFFQKSPR